MYQQIETAPEVYISTASLWEVVIKIQLKKLTPDPGELAAKIADSGFQELPVSVRHTLLLNSCRFTIGTPLTESCWRKPTSNLRLLTSDSSLKPYGPVCQVVS